jgi:hypothetical protein
MTAEQATEFLNNYGPVIWFFFLTIVFIVTLVKAWPFITAVVKTVEIIGTLPEKFQYVHDKLECLEQALKVVEHEVRTNGGSSIKDAVKRIEDRLDNI